MFSHNGPRILRCAVQTQKRSLQSFTSPILSQFASKAAHESSKYQIYVSSTDDPYLNLSIEHHLLETSSAESTILFLYANRPCVVIGRNQNPWLETNIRALCLPRSTSVPVSLSHDAFTSPPSRVELVRRRSGGGTVFHGPGNVNYSVICPSANFTRDKHAEMVARALQSMNCDARVNERHDIVLMRSESLLNDTSEALPREASPLDSTVTAAPPPTPRKVSGSAYKLTRGRALHHGTCLLCTPHLDTLSYFLSSPARGFLHARSVDSVRSPVANVLPPVTDATSLRRDVEEFQASVLRAFADLYPAASLSGPDIDSILDAVTRAEWSGTSGLESEPTTPENEQGAELLTLHAHTIAGVLGPGLATVPRIRDGMAELRSNVWLFGQTPRFTLSSAYDSPPAKSSVNFRRASEWLQEGPILPQLPAGVQVYLSARNGVISGVALARATSATETKAATWTCLEDAAERDGAAQLSQSPAKALNGRKLWEMEGRDWEAAMKQVDIRDMREEDGESSGAGKSASRGWEKLRQTAGRWVAGMLALPRRET